MTREELRDYVEEQRSLNMIPYHVYSTLIDGIDALQEPKIKILSSKEVAARFTELDFYSGSLWTEFMMRLYLLGLHVCEVKK